MSLTKSTVTYSGLDIGLRLLNFAALPLFAHALTMAEFGILALVVSLMGLLESFFIGVNHSLERYYWDRINQNGSARTLVTTALAITASLAVLILVVSACLLFPFRQVVAQKYGIEWFALMATLAALLPLHLVTSTTMILRLKQSLRSYALVIGSQHVLTLGLTLILVVGFHKQILGYCVGSLVAAALVLPFALLTIRRELAGCISREEVARIIRFGYPFIFTGLAYWIFASIDRWMLCHLGTMEEVGLYAVAFKGVLVLQILTYGFGRAWNPYAFRAYAERDDYKQLYSRVLVKWFYFLIVCSAGVSLFGPDLIALVFPPQYRAAAPILPFLSIGVAYWGTSAVLGTGISLMEKSKLFAWASWLSAGLNVILNLFFIPRMGAVGAAIASAIAFGGLALFYLVCSQRLHPLPLDWKRLGLLVILSLALLWTASEMASLAPTTTLLLLKSGLFGAVVIVGFALKIVLLSDLVRLPIRALKVGE